MTKATLSSIIDGIYCGQVQHRWEGRGSSAINKAPVTGPQTIDENGFIDDAQADLEHHGGSDKAIHHYASDHYPTWITEGEIPKGSIPAAFGENIATTGITEETLNIGDILSLGTAVVQVSQGRQPCWKLSEHTGNKRMAYLFQKAGRTGWYYRILQGGNVGVGNKIQLLERPQPNWSIKRVTAARLLRQVSDKEAAILSEMPELAMGWRAAFAKMASGNRSEDTTKRLDG